MQKLTALLLAALIILLAGCASDQPGVTTAPTAPSTTAPTVEPVTQPSVSPTTQPTTQPTTEPSTAPTEPDRFDAEACAPLFGTWKTTVTIDKELLNTSYFNKKVKFDLFYTFNEDGSFAVHVDEEKFKAAIEEFEGLMVDHMVERGYTTFKAEMERDGYSATRIETMWAEGEEAKVRSDSQEFMKGLNLLGRFSELLREGSYYVEEGRVYTALAESGYESNQFEVKSGSLTLSDTDNREIYRMLCINFPLTLEKV